MVGNEVGGHQIDADEHPISRLTITDLSQALVADQKKIRGKKLNLFFQKMLLGYEMRHLSRLKSSNIYFRIKLLYSFSMRAAALMRLILMMPGSYFKLLNSTKSYSGELSNNSLRIEPCPFPNITRIRSFGLSVMF